jgi:hypothetical protein
VLWRYEVGQRIAECTLLMPSAFGREQRLPHRHGDLDALSFVTKLAKELTQHPDSATKDLVMADWQDEWNMARILAVARRSNGMATADAKLPAYLARRQHELVVD